MPALAGVASADAGVTERSAQSDESTASGPSITTDSERLIAGTSLEFQLSSDGESIDRVQWEVEAPNGTVTATRTNARRGLDVDWADDPVRNTDDPTEFRHEPSSEGDYTVRATYGEEPATVERTVSVSPERLTAQLLVNETEPVVGEPFFVIGDATGNVSESSIDYDGGTTLMARSWHSLVFPKFPETFRSQLHTFQEAGEHEITYSVRNATGATDVDRTTVDVRPEGPDADVDARLESTYDGPGSGRVVNRTVEFDAGDTVGTVSEYVWLFGDGELDFTSAPTTTHSYQENGTYEATVIAVGPNATDRESVRTTVGGGRAVPSISVTLEDSLVDGEVQFRVQPSLESTREYRWEFSDGDVSNTTRAFEWRSWSESGTYTANVTLVPWSGNSTTLARTVRVDVDGSAPNVSVPNETAVVEPRDWGDGNDSGDDGSSDDGPDDAGASDESDDGGSVLVPTTDTGPEAPSFQIQSVDVPENVDPGSDAEVTVEVENDGGAGDGEVTASLSEGAQQQVAVSAGSDESDAVTASVEAPANAGEYDLQVQTASDKQTVTLSVAGSAGEAGAGNATEPAPSSDDESADSDGSADGDDSTPAFGVLGSVLALTASVLALRRRS